MFGIANALGRRLGIKQAAASLPFTARSLTADEVRTLVSEELTWLSTSLALLMIMGGGIYVFIGIPPGYGPLLGGLAAAVLLMLALSAVWRVRRRAGYVDPLVRIEVSETGIEVRRPGGSEGKSYAELAVTDILVRQTRSGSYFEGIVIETASGAVKLGDEWFDGGNAAAGAILRRMDQLGAPLRLRGGILS